MEEEKWVYVTKEKFEDFISTYPNPLEKDWFMDWWSWNDFSDGKKWPESMIALSQEEFYFGHIYKIRKDLLN